MTVVEIVTNYWNKLGLTIRTVVVFILVLKVVYDVYNKRSRRYKLPPGPISWPVIGNALQLGSNPHLTLTKWRAVYGDIFMMKIGSKSILVLNGKEAITEALVHQRTQFSGRPNFESAKHISGGNSLTFLPLPVSIHKTYRKLLIDSIRNYVLPSTKSKQNVNLTTKKIRRITMLEKNLRSRSESLIDRLVKAVPNQNIEEQNYVIRERNSPVFIELAWETCTTLCSSVFGYKYSLRDPRIEFFLRQNDEFSKVIGLTNLYDMMPWIKYVRPNILEPFIKLNKTLERFIQNTINEHVVSFKQKVIEIKSWENFTPANIIDSLLAECRRRKEEENFSEDKALAIVSDLIGAGFDTISKSIEWLVTYAAVFPDAQKRLQKELDSFVEENGDLPLYSDRAKVPYLWAFIHEVLRHASFVPFTIPHSPTAKNLKLNGFDIPSDCVIFVNQWSVNHDPQLWKTPEHFRPERFITKDGVFDATFGSQVLIFGMGRRSCPGRSIAEIQMIHILGTILHKCNLTLVPGNSGLPNTKYGLVMQPQQGNLLITLRT